MPSRVGYLSGSSFELLDTDVLVYASDATVVTIDVAEVATSNGGIGAYAATEPESLESAASASLTAMAEVADSLHSNPSPAANSKQAAYAELKTATGVVAQEIVAEAKTATSSSLASVWPMPIADVRTTNGVSPQAVRFDKFSVTALATASGGYGSIYRENVSRLATNPSLAGYAAAENVNLSTKSQQSANTLAANAEPLVTGNELHATKAENLRTETASQLALPDLSDGKLVVDSDYIGAAAIHTQEHNVEPTITARWDSDYTANDL